MKNNHGNNCCAGVDFPRIYRSLLFFFFFFFLVNVHVGTQINLKNISVQCTFIIILLDLYFQTKCIHSLLSALTLCNSPGKPFQLLLGIEAQPYILNDG